MGNCVDGVGGTAKGNGLGSECVLDVRELSILALAQPYDFCRYHDFYPASSIDPLSLRLDRDGILYGRPDPNQQC
jgi:hypothetical protein